MKPAIQFIKRKDGVKIAYTTFGKGPYLVYTPPWVSNLSDIFENQFQYRFFEQLSRKMTVVTYDKHGCGQSDRDRKNFDIEAELFDLSTVMDQIKPKKAILMGLGCSGPVSLEYTSHHPENVTSVVLCGSFANGPTVGKKEVRSALISLVKASWGLGSKTIYELFNPGASAEELNAFAKFQRESCSPEIAAKLMEFTFLANVSNLLSSFEKPTLILHREGDKTIPIQHGRQLAMGIPNSTFKVLKGNVHLPWCGNSNEIIEEILEFVDAREPIPRTESAEAMDDENNEVVKQATIVFTDIVSSTELVTKLGDAKARELFRKHDKIIRSQIGKYKGKELQSLGDGFMLSFDSASAAIKCTCKIQREITKNLPSIKIRIGINAGEVVLKEGKHPFGQAVVIASRIVSKANGDEILVSDVIKHLTSGSIFTFGDKGSFEFKGIDGSVKLHEISWKN
jgi:class 3 adenylate cyclase